MARRLRQVVDLYVTGEVTVLMDGTPVWVQPLNPFEADTARNEAQIAKSRLAMAIRELGSSEQQRVRDYFLSDGIEGSRERLVDAKVTERSTRIFDSIRNDPDWTEKLQILERGAEETGAMEPEEQELLVRLTNEYAIEIGRRLDDERTFQVEQFADHDEDTLWKEYLDWFIDRRASEKMMTEFRLHQIFFGVRWCDGTKNDDVWEHSACNGHSEPMFNTKDEIRRAPEALIELLYDACESVDMTAREAKNSDRQGSSSDSSPLPSAAAESTASTQDETPVAPPGSSSSRSDTPSPSLVSAS